MTNPNKDANDDESATIKLDMTFTNNDPQSGLVSLSFYIQPQQYHHKKRFSQSETFETEENELTTQELLDKYLHMGSIGKL